MKVKELIEELSKVNPNFDVMISVGRKGERDLIEKVGNIECPNSARFPDFGWVELVSCNPIDFGHYGWIPVSERLPVPYKDVLITNGITTYVGWFDPAAKRWRVSESEYFDIVGWMPLPTKPYESQESEE